MPSKITPAQGAAASDLDSFRHYPLVRLRRIYLEFLQILFKAAPVGYFHWSEEDEVSEIILQDESVVNPSVAGTRPAITLTRAPVSYNSLGFDDMLQYDIATGKKTKSVLIPGTMSINCVSRSSIETELLCGLVADALWMNREWLLARGFYEVGRQLSIGAPSPAGSIVPGDNGTGWYVCSVQSPFYIYRTSESTPLGVSVFNGAEITLNVPQAAVAPAQNVLNGTLGPPVGTYESVPSALPPDAAVAPELAGVRPEPDRVYDPLNPTREVTVKYVRAPNSRLATRRLLPIGNSTVVQSKSQALREKLKV